MSWKRQEPIIFFLVVAIAVLPVWLVPVFPSQDGPIHLWMLHLLSQLDNLAAQDFIEFNPHAEPNLLFYLLAYPVSRLGGVFIAERFFLTLLAFLFCFGARYAVLRISSHSGPISFLVVPILFNYYLHMGFYNFLVGTSLFLPALVLSIDYYRRPGSASLAKLSLVGTVVILGHLVAFGALVSCLGVYILADQVRTGIRNHRLGETVSHIWMHAVRVALAFLPAFFIASWFFLRHGPSRTAGLSMGRMIRAMAELHVLTSFADIESILISFPYAALLAILSCSALWLAMRPRTPNSEWLPLAMVVVAMMSIYGFVPLSAKGVPANPRLSLYILLVVVMWLSTVHWPPMWRRIIPVSCVILVITSASIRAIQYRSFNEELQQYFGISSHVASGATLLQVRLDYRPEEVFGRQPRIPRGRVEPFLHTGAYVAIRNDAIYLGSTLMSRKIFGYFPLVYRREMDPFVALGWRVEGRYPVVDFRAFEDSFRRPIDYLLVLGDDWKEWVDQGEEQAMSYEGLLARYEILDRSPNGQIQLFGLREELRSW